MEKTWKITLADGTVLAGLGLNGNNFVSDSELTKETFEGKLSEVTFEGKVNGQDFSHTCRNMDLVQIVHYPDGWYFILRELTGMELESIKIQSDIEYVAMMAGVEI